ncbi:TetR family transcriptional regulator [Bradyrhizobium sp. SSBR45G]|nr:MULTISPECIES: TetR/AcrR family transcriptional regulator [unclassified Bradyrhizobium]GLH75714.1 TetR family transcriptional regulator [Bradyrhizobium sp. SSBR45G]GLH85720.1 TetR family transcriptional regulator [Bradyrhizobium sp. SSBR45R]
MTTRPQQGRRRAHALSKAQIVRAAIEILDRDGEHALTFRALSARLATGSGAIFWHVADKEDLLAAATEEIIARLVAEPGNDMEPKRAIRAVALAVFDAIDAHSWLGGQLFRNPAQPAALRISEMIGRSVQALGVPERALFNCWSALINYMLGVAAQNAANARQAHAEADRSAFLANVANRWAHLDPTEFAFVRQVADELRDHDDREQFLAGIDLILAGIGTLTRRADPSP